MHTVTKQYSSSNVTSTSNAPACSQTLTQVTTQRSCLYMFTGEADMGIKTPWDLLIQENG